MNLINENAKYSSYRRTENNFELDVKTNQLKIVGATQKTYEFLTHGVNTIKTDKVGLMMVGFGGNNGSTLTAMIKSNEMHHKLGNDMSWRTRNGVEIPNFYGSVTQSATFRVGQHEKRPVYYSMNELVPMLSPYQLVLGGWDISNMNIAQAMDRAQVLEAELKDKIKPVLESYVPLPSVYYSDFIALNQVDRANNVIPWKGNKKYDIDQIRQDIRQFKQANNLDRVIVLWTANTERYSKIIPGVNTTWAELSKTLVTNTSSSSDTEVSPSTCFAIACLLEGVAYINGAPMNTFVPAVYDLAQQLYDKRNNITNTMFNINVDLWNPVLDASSVTFIAGDDFKTGQTKFKSVLVDYLIGAGIKPVSIASYNHLGNNDGRNLSEPEQFRSKEISKSNVVDDMVESNNILYDQAKNEKPDHIVAIKYMPYVKDSKRAIDEYICEIAMGGRQTFNISNVCEDSLLAAPLMLDLVLLTEFFGRVQIKDDNSSTWKSMDPVLSVLSYFLKAPISQKGHPVVNALGRQRAALENTLKVLAGIALCDELLFS